MPEGLLIFYELTKLFALLSTWMFAESMIIAIYLLADIDLKYIVRYDQPGGGPGDHPGSGPGDHPRSGP